NIKNALNNKITLLNALSSHQPTLTKNQILEYNALTVRIKIVEVDAENKTYLRQHDILMI
ncbi:hypothetical protein ACJQOR_001678, partial [Staphylococcus pseudintermedius]